VQPGESTSGYVREVTRNVARRAEADKRFSTTILLYHLADEHENVMRAINAELGRVLARPAPAAPEQRADASLTELANQNPVAVARSMLVYYKRAAPSRSAPSTRSIEVCEALVQLQEAFAAYEQGQLEVVLQVRLICDPPLALS
jgi:hypothetical protein